MSDNIKQFVKDKNMATLHSISGEGLHYRVVQGGAVWQFSIPLSEISGGVFREKMKAIELMRWIRKAIDADELMGVGTVPEQGVQG